MTPAKRLHYAALSDVGRVRKDNQDSGYAGPNLLVIADGVGGAARGDIASSVAVETLRRLDVQPGNAMLEELAGSIARIHDRLGELVDDHPELEGTSTTVSAALFDGTQLALAHVGDSRAYLLRDGELRQLTTDHTFVQSLIDEGRISDEEARVHPHRNLILKAVDGVREPEPDLSTVPLELGDRLLFCSDGCSGSVDDAGITTLLGDGSPEQAAVALVQAALEAGSTDNVTVVIAEVVTDATAAPAADADAEDDGSEDDGSEDDGSGDEGEPEDAGESGAEPQDDDTHQIAKIAPDDSDQPQDDDTHRIAKIAPDDAEAALATGPMLVGAAAEMPRPDMPGRTDTAERGAVRPAPGGGASGDSGSDPAGSTAKTDERPADPEALRYAPRAPRRFVWLRRVLAVLVLALIVYAGGRAAYAWTQTQYYVGADSDTVVIYKGVEANLPGIDMHKVYERSDVKVGDLTSFNQRQVDNGIGADNLAEARKILQRLRTSAACENAIATPTPTPAPTRTTKKPGKRPGKTKPPRTARPPTSATPSPTATPSTPPDCTP